MLALAKTYSKFNTDLDSFNRKMYVDIAIFTKKEIIVSAFADTLNLQI